MKLTLSTIADIIPIGEFIECVEAGVFIDYDGFGNLGTETHESDYHDVCPSDIGYVLANLTDEERETFTHVHWYNR